MNERLPDHVIDAMRFYREKGVEVSTDAPPMTFSRAMFETLMLVEADGLELLRKLESGAHREAECRGLVHAYSGPSGVCFDVKDWRALVEFLRREA